MRKESRVVSKTKLPSAHQHLSLFQPHLLQPTTANIYKKWNVERTVFLYSRWHIWSLPYYFLLEKKKQQNCQTILYGAKIYVIKLDSGKRMRKQTSWNNVNATIPAMMKHLKMQRQLSHCLESWAWTKSATTASVHLWLALLFESLQTGNLSTLQTYILLIKLWVQLT